ncbi:MAG: hypothetical protein CMJ23_13680 [Phycisphaerae bacterium]|nr:hypothetical protein [Phycisphaerae bacterium]
MSPSVANSEDVVITAAAACCSLGEGRHAILEAMLRDEVRIDAAPAIESTFMAVDGEPSQPVRAAQAFEAEPHPGGDGDRAERFLQRTIMQAMEEAGLRDGVPPMNAGRPRRVESIFGTTLGGMRHLGRAMRTDDLADYAGSLTGTVTRAALRDTGLPLGGSTISAACASGVSAMALASTALLLDECDLAIAIAYDPISEFAFAGFSCLRLIAEGPLRPFTVDREGMRVGEGYGVFVLERAPDARARGASPLARVLGWGAASDAHHLTQPIPDGRGAARAIREAAVAPPDLVIAHATSTPANDAAEHAAMQAAFGERFPSIPVTALKSRIGHTLGAAGAVELSVLIASMETGRIPGAANATADRESFPTLDLVTSPRDRTVDRGVVLSLGFGGADAAIEIESMSVTEPTPSAPPIHALDDVVVTGVGILVPSSNSASIRDGELGLEPEALEGLDNPRAVRRLARFAQLVRAAGRLATDDAGLGEAEIRSSAAFVGTRFGASEYTLDFYDELIRDGLGAGNPLHFAESVPNIGSAQLSLGLGIEGLTLSTSGTRLAGIEALHLARRHLASGQADRAIVVAAEETHPRIRSILRRLRLLDERPTAEGAVALVLERRSAAAARSGTIRADLASTRIVWPPREGWRGSVDAWRMALQDTESEVCFCGADHASEGPGDRLVARATPGNHLKTGQEVVERHSVGPLLAVANAVTGDFSVTIGARDEAGGSGSAAIKAV